MRGPTQPVCRVGESCSAPAVGLILVFSHGGHVVARVKTVTGGRYSVRLQPATYTVTTAPRVKVGIGIRPASVRLRTAATVNFFVDTGIR